MTTSLPQMNAASQFPQSPPKEQPLRVLHVISGIDPENGGPSRALLGLTAAQVKVGLYVRVLATWQRASAKHAAEEFHRSGVEVKLVGPATGRLSRHPDLQNTVAKEVACADIIHIHALFEEVQHLAAVTARRAKTPYIFRTCGMLDPWSWSQGAFRKKLYWHARLKRHMQRATAIHAVSPIEAGHIERFNVGTRVIMEYNGLDLSEFETLPPAGYLRRRHAAIRERPIVLFMSRLHPKKGLNLLIPAVRRAIDGLDLDQDSAARPFLVVAGPGEPAYVDHVRQLIREYRLEQDAWLPGMLAGNDRVAAMADATLFALTSYQENFGIAVAEAMAAGLPLLITDQVALHPIVNSERTGRVVPTDSAIIAQALVDLLRDSENRKSMGQRARDVALRTFDWLQIAERWRTHYHALGCGAKTACTGFHRATPKARK